MPVDELQQLWVPGTRVVYIGKANHGGTRRRGLCKRLDEFRRFGAGEPIGHPVAAGSGSSPTTPTSSSDGVKPRTPEAAAIETAMIAQFRAHHGRLLLANMRA